MRNRILRHLLLCVYASETINLLGYRRSKGVLQPDPDRVKPVLDMPVPCNAKELQRMLGMFSYYAKWIPHYSEKIKPLVVLKKFPLNDEVLHALTTLKTDLSSATLGVIDENLPFTFEDLQFTLTRRTMPFQRH